ncbi:hypothetical protein ACFVZW_36850, partial [Streptomyces sp. NPDC059567]|uniref:hypothetical protein n=1 Tax=Streptomyces sp. NPDC059567 TaxID=3346867 RepID=UPI0036D10F09
LSGELSPAEVGTAVMRIASCNDVAPEGDRPPRPADAFDSFLYGLLTFDSLFAASGLRVTDNSTGVTFLPGCCDGLEDWRDWHQFADGGSLLGFGHDPLSPVAERFGDTVRLTVNADQSDSPVVELSITELRNLLAGAESDLADFLALAADWASRHLSGHCARRHSRPRPRPRPSHAGTAAAVGRRGLASSAKKAGPYGLRRGEHVRVYLPGHFDVYADASTLIRLDTLAGIAGIAGKTP